MAGIKKEPGPTARRVAAAVYRLRHGVQDITTAEMSKRLDVLGQPIPDTGITKTEKGTRRVDVDDLVPIALALGVTPNTLLMPPVGYLGSSEVHQLTPAVSGTAERLWQWAQGEKPISMPVPGSSEWLGGGDLAALEFSVRSRPYLTAPHNPLTDDPAGGPADTGLRDISVAVLKALENGAPGEVVRRVVELSIALPATMAKREGL